MKPSRHLLHCICAAVLAATLSASAESSAPIVEGQTAPLFSGQDQDGIHWNLLDHVGKKLVYLYFYPKDDTSGCTAEACSLRDNMVELNQAGVEIVGVSFDDKDSHKNFIFKYNLSFPLLADTDGAIADAYGTRVGEHKKMSSPIFLADEIKDLSGMIERLKQHSDPVSEFLWKGLSKPEQALLIRYEPSSPISMPAQEVVVGALQKIIEGPSIYKVKRFKGVALRPETVGLLKQNPKGAHLIRLNRLLLEDTYPRELSRNQNVDRRISFLIGVDGKVIHVTDSPDPAVHMKELTATLAALKGKASP